MRVRGDTFDAEVTPRDSRTSPARRTHASAHTFAHTAARAAGRAKRVQCVFLFWLWVGVN